MRTRTAYSTKTGPSYFIKFFGTLSQASSRPMQSWDGSLTRTPLGYFYNAPHWGGAISSPPPPPTDLRNYWTDSKNSSGIWKPWKNCWKKTNFIDFGDTSDVTDQVKVKMFDISGLVTSASKIAMLRTNKANKSAWIVSLTFVSIIYYVLWHNIGQGHLRSPGKNGQAKNFVI